jgi:hypothetical protein
MATLSGYGVAIDLPPGWDGRITRRPVDPTPPAASAFAAASGRDLSESTHAVAHVGNFALPERRGDFGSGAVESMGPSHVFAVLLEYHPDSAATALFASHGIPARLDPAEFSPQALQHALPGQGGGQWFFQESGRAWCLYVVLGSFGARALLVPPVERMLAGIRIDRSTGSARWSA